MSLEAPEELLACRLDTWVVVDALFHTLSHFRRWHGQIWAPDLILGLEIAAILSGQPGITNRRVHLNEAGLIRIYRRASGRLSICLSNLGCDIWANVR